MAMPRHVPTEEQRETVRRMVSHGIRRDIIAKVIGISEPTLLKYYHEELETAAAIANSQVAQSLFDKATSDKHPQAVTAAIFWLKTRARWRTVDQVTIGSEDGNPVRIVNETPIPLMRLPIEHKRAILEAIEAEEAEAQENGDG